MKIIIILIILISFLIILNILNKKIEYFEYYKKNTIQLTLQSHKPLIISTGSEDSYYSRIVKIISNIYPLEILYHEEPFQQNIINLISKDCDLAICQLDSANNAYTGKNIFTNSNQNLRYICSLYTESITLIANLQSNINSWNDIENKVICIGETNSASYYNFINLLSVAGIDESNVTLITKNISDEEVLEQFMNNEIDALYSTTQHPLEFIDTLYN